MDTLEDALLLSAAALFLGLSAIFLGQVLWGPTPGAVLPWLPLAILCFVGALAAKELSPRNRGRMLRLAIEQYQRPVSAEEFGQLQQSVGSAGFFNRVGLTGIPLAVALLALVLSGLVFAARTLGYDEPASAFLNMTTLAVGAFVGTLTRTTGAPRAGED